MARLLIRSATLPSSPGISIGLINIESSRRGRFGLAFSYVVSARRAVIHHLSVRQNLQTRLGRLHLQVAQNKFVFAFFQFPDSFGSTGSGINVIPTGFEDRFEG